MNSKTKIAIEGKDADILDDTGREVKLPITKKTKSELTYDAGADEVLKI